MTAPLPNTRPSTTYRQNIMKWFTVAKEGQTTDGRKILRAWLEQIAETFNRQTYGARVWLEHLRGTLPDSPFKAYGDVTAVRTQEGDDGKLILQAQIDPTPALIAMNKDRQKIYTSIEVDPNFAETGKAYLLGLGVTDTPASLGTDALAFCAQHPEEVHPFKSRKQNPNTLFTSAIPVEFDFSGDQSDHDAGLLTKITEMFKAMTAKAQPEKFSELAQAFTAFAQAYAQTQKDTADSVEALAAKVDSMGAGFVTAEQFQALTDKLDLTDRTPGTRAPAKGGDGVVRTDC
ncbi:hypothetical protein CAL26_06000 [Bordetella genomosp. 9]|uniref:Phage capsid protein n=2 Tax=Bordetella genomosp. 9 TaxID=1416803 RepID=A0A261RDF2_9BORD|nr:hypothetical protein CAL26_06000 [Bordetella genomosp. 9]